MVGLTDGHKLNVLAVEQTKGIECVRFGIIQNPEETANRISDILDKLESRPEIHPRRINALYVGIGGRSMRSITSETEINLPEESEITTAILDELKQNALRKAIDSSLEVVDALPRYYKVDSTVTHTPIGRIGNKINATFDLIVCRPALQKNIGRTLIEKLDIEIPNMIVTPLAVSHVAVSDNEKKLGCMLVDMGAETTTVIIFKDGNMHYYATLPLGSRNITRDLTSLNILEDRADEIKKISGNAIAPDTESSIEIDGIRQSDISHLVVARAEEIAANICQQIEYAGLTSKDLPAGIIAIGGGFQLKGMPELTANQCNLKIRTGKIPPYINIEDTRANSYDIIQLSSVLYVGATMSDTECLEKVVEEELPATGDEFVHNEDLPAQNNNNNQDEKESSDKNSGKLELKFKNLFNRFKNAMTYKEDDDEDDLI
jgi:cell division protein FtsA